MTESEKSTIDLSRLCRTCNTKSSHMSPLFARGTEGEPGLHDMLMSCTNLKIFKADGFPNSICDDCVDKLNTAYQFKQQCETSDQYYKELGLKLNSDCTETTLVYNKEMDYDYIEILENKATIFKCRECCRAFDTLQGLKDHKSIHSKSDKIDLEIQYYVEEEDPLELKEESEEEVINDSYLDENPVNDDEDSEYSSRLSEKPKYSKTDQLQILQSHEDTKKCIETYSCSSYLWEHDYVQKEHFKYLLTSLDKSYSKRKNLVEHQWKHRIGMKKRLQLFKCDVCGKSFASDWYLGQHKKTHDLSRNQMPDDIAKRCFKCDICNKSYSRRTNLYTHMRTHKSEGQCFECDVCNKSFSQSCYLRKHQLIHENAGTKRFKCDICGKLFSQRHYLLKHKLSHKGSKRKRFECDICDKWYFHSHSLKKHKRMHDKPSRRSMKEPRDSFEPEPMAVAWMKTETFDIKTEIEPEESMIITSLEREPLENNIEIKQEYDRFC